MIIYGYKGLGVVISTKVVMVVLSQRQMHKRREQRKQSEKTSF